MKGAPTIYIYKKSEDKIKKYLREEPTLASCVPDNGQQFSSKKRTSHDWGPQRGHFVLFIGITPSPSPSVSLSVSLTLFLYFFSSCPFLSNVCPYDTAFRTSDVLFYSFPFSNFFFYLCSLTLLYSPPIQQNEKTYSHISFEFSPVIFSLCETDLMIDESLYSISHL